MDKNIDHFIQDKRVVIVGASRSGKKFGNIAGTELKNRGYQVAYVHPSAEEIDGQKTFRSLAEARGEANCVFVSVSPTDSEKVVREAGQAGFQNIWLQQGAESEGAAAAARELGLHAVSGKCILMYAAPVKGMHIFHRGFMRLIGQL